MTIRLSISMRRFVIGMFALVLASASLSTKASTVAGDYVGGGSFFSFSRAIGWIFTADADLEVSQLGIYDIESDGLVSSHSIGIFEQQTGAVVASATIDAGDSGTFVEGTIGGSRLVDIDPVILEAGTSYYILGDNFADERYAFGDFAVLYASGLSWTGVAEGETNDIFSTMSVFFGEPGNLGPTFSFSVVPVPSAVWLFVTGLGMLGIFKRRRSTR